MDSTVDKKIKALTALQEVDSTLDEIIKVRGDLPLEVQDLEDEIAGYQTRIDNIESQISEFNGNINAYKAGIKEANDLIAKYTDQQRDVRNNREYDAITKEIELQELETQILEKRIREANISIERKQEQEAEVKAILDDRQKDVKAKQDQLDVIIAESREEEEKLNTKRQKASKSLDDRLLKAYTKIRNNARNGLAVVSIRRNACGGCFNTIPPQMQADVKDRKKLMICEHCGRILGNVELYIEEEKPKRKVTKKATTKKTAAKKTATKKAAKKD